MIQYHILLQRDFFIQENHFKGMGVYYSDMLDYISFYARNETFTSLKKNFGKVIPLGITFSLVGTIVFYNKEKKKDIYDYRYYHLELDHFPTYEEILSNYPDKMVEKNGIHFSKVNPYGGHVYNREELELDSSQRKGAFVGNEYVITEKEQFLPLYGVTLKRNEYLVIWKESNKIENNNCNDNLRIAKKILYKIEDINIYIENSTEKALELIKRKKFNKIILISSIGIDLSGKKFIDIARRILGFDVMVLLFSTDIKHLQWIKNFPNALYTNNTTFFEKYIKNYNMKGLLNLKEEIENNFKIKLKFM